MKNKFLTCLFLMMHGFLYGQLSGTYTIGGLNANYSTIAQATNALESIGISGPVIFNIRDGIYFEPISLNGNSVTGSSITNTITFQSESQNPTAVIIEDLIFVALEITYATGIIINNLSFNGRSMFGFTSNSKFINNICNPCSSCSWSLTNSFSDSILIAKNIFNAGLRNSYGTYDTIINNFIFGYFRNSFANNNVIAFNNFDSDPASEFHNSGDSCLIVNNIMPALFDNWYVPNTIVNNNYPFGGGNLDSLPIFIDPQYINSTNLNATNPQLVGKGKYYSEFYDDINSMERPDPPTIGANEICIASNFVNSFCGDSLTLALCNMPSGNNFLWNPSSGLNDPHLARPKVYTTTSQWYFVSDSVLSYSDSVFINVIPFNVYAGDDDSIIYCGNNIMLIATYNASATYQWSPVDSLSSPNLYNTVANPSQSTQYTVVATVSGCPITMDSVNVLVNPIPVSYVYLASQNHNDICFMNVSTCADNYLWDFGDSTFSNDFDPCHIYSDTGSFLVTLIACNSFGCDTFVGSVYVDTTLISIVVEVDLADDIIIFPNPAKGNLTVVFDNMFKSARMEIINSLGTCVYKYSNLDTYNTFNFDLLPGIYIIRLFADNRIINKKLVVD